VSVMPGSATEMSSRNFPSRTCRTPEILFCRSPSVPLNSKGRSFRIVVSIVNSPSPKGDKIVTSKSKDSDLDGCTFLCVQHPDRRSNATNGRLAKAFMGNLRRTMRVTYRRWGRRWSGEKIQECARSAERKPRAAVRCRRIVIGSAGTHSCERERKAKSPRESRSALLGSYRKCPVSQRKDAGVSGISVSWPVPLSHDQWPRCGGNLMRSG
jgi:hypothetical protein